MKIALVVPGFGDSFYCENCLRDFELPRAFKRLGHEVVAIPMYLPLSQAMTNTVSYTPLFYGAVSVYLEERIPLLRRINRWTGGLLDSRVFLHWASKFAGSTRATGLEEMTISVLMGEEGHQSAELSRLADYLKVHVRPDVIHLSNGLLLGLAGKLRKDLGVPVACTLQDEEAWIDSMEDSSSVWNVLKEKVKDASVLLPVSRYYAGRMHRRLDLGQDRMRVVYAGIDTEGYERAPSSLESPVIGFLSRLSESLGLGILIEAFIRLKKDPRLAGLRLYVTGGATSDDRRFLARVHRMLSKRGINDDLVVFRKFDRESRIRFLQSLSVLSVPVREGEAFGTFLVEALAAGVPVVQPRSGVFPEIVDMTGGGLLCEPGDPVSLADSLSALLLDPDRAREIGMRGQSAVRSVFHIDKMAVNLIHIYEEL